MTSPLHKRPEAEIKRLISALEPFSTPLELTSDESLHWEYQGRQQFYIIKSGELSVLREADGLVITTVDGQSLFGVAENLHPLRKHILRAETDCLLLRLDASLGHELICTAGLWQDMAAILAYHTAFLLYRDTQVVGQRTYSVIRSLLLEMNNLILDHRLRVSVLEYIQERTLLSRSSILNVVSALKTRGYIEITRGSYLLQVICLPERL
jgi:CRP-like cAMP-binding protein